MTFDLPPCALATDLDGTLIPINGEPAQKTALCKIDAEHRQKKFPLVFVTGRHLSSVQQAIEQFHLPVPDWVICDVGTSIFQTVDGGFQLVEAYHQDLDQKLSPEQLKLMGSQLSQHRKLTRQEEEKQGRFKLSFYTEAQSLNDVVAEIKQIAAEIEFQLIASVDPFNGDGLIDILPAKVSKRYGLSWWAREQSLSTEDIVFAGDSGNDWAAIVGGFRSIVVANAAAELKAQVEAADDETRRSIFVASQQATSGVLEGCRHWGLLE